MGFKGPQSKSECPESANVSRTNSNKNKTANNACVARGNILPIYIFFNLKYLVFYATLQFRKRYFGDKNWDQKSESKSRTDIDAIPKPINDGMIKNSEGSNILQRTTTINM